MRPCQPPFFSKLCLHQTNQTSLIFRPTALRVALVIGSILFIVNHGNALLNGKMSRDRWISSFITYLVPYTVSIHGQFSAHSQQSGELEA
ncbi:MAG: nitrate/nitrite transporter NrtS [Leptolyngbyaceae bacterium]|nr:nitrate/nitrite transporter NrtS [Leptolyngbyaceae bacterium]